MRATTTYGTTRVTTRTPDNGHPAASTRPMSVPEKLGGSGVSVAPSLRPPLLTLLLLILLNATGGGLAAPDITMSIHGGNGGISAVETADDRGKPYFTIEQIHTLLAGIDFKLRDLSHTFRRDQQMDRINSRIDIMLNKLNHLETTNSVLFDKFQQLVVEECGQNQMTRRLDKDQQQQENTLEHIESTLQTVENYQKETEIEIRKVADRQMELSADVQSVRKYVGSEFDKQNSSQNEFRKHLQNTVTNLAQQFKVTNRSLSTCSCNQNDDPGQIPAAITINKLESMVNGMYDGLRGRSDNTHILLKEFVDITDKHRRKLEKNKDELENFLEAAFNDLASMQKQSESELEAKFKEQLQVLLEGQNLFMKNCHRLQSNERQIENDMITILSRIMDLLENKNTPLEKILNTLKAQSDRVEMILTELSEVGKMQSDQVARTVAYSTNQVIKLQQDIKNISDALVAINGAGASGPHNATTTMAINGGVHNTSHNSNPLTTKNKSSTEYPPWTQPESSRTIRGY